MATLYEYYNTGDDGAGSVWGINWWAQTFIPSTAHKIISVKLLLDRVGYPGTATVSITATVAGKPSGADLCSGMTNGNTLPTGPPCEWREITLGAGTNLAADTKYAIVVRASTGDATNRVRWWRDSSSPTYTGGNACFSNDSGSSWSSATATDMMFEDWGEAIVTTYDTMVGLPTSWLWEKCDYDSAEKCPVGAETGWIWKEPTSGGPDKTPQGLPTSFSWGGE